MRSIYICQKRFSPTILILVIIIIQQNKRMSRELTLLINFIVYKSNSTAPDRHYWVNPFRISKDVPDSTKSFIMSITSSADLLVCTDFFFHGYSSFCPFFIKCYIFLLKGYLPFSSLFINQSLIELSRTDTQIFLY